MSVRMLIPRIFHLIWVGPHVLPADYERWRDGWRQMHPDWTLMLWTDENLPPLRNWKEYRRATTFAQMADIARYEIVYRYGGVYLDADMECFQAIDSLLDGIEAFAAWLEPEEIGTGIFGATREHPWLLDLITALPESTASGFDILHQTGPRFFTPITQRRTDIVLFDESVFYGEAISQRSSIAVHHTQVAVHHAAKSWVPQHLVEVAAKLATAANEIDHRVPEGGCFISVDDEVGILRYTKRRGVSFMFPNGTWLERPADDVAAIERLLRMRAEGASHIAFIGTSRWWLNYYKGFRDSITSTADLVIDNDLVTLFEFH